MRNHFVLLALGLCALPPLSAAAEPVPEIKREPAAPQQAGAVHTLRTVPEACTRLQGVFTDDPAAPYRLEAVRTSPQCQPRARFVPFEEAAPAPATGWLLNDLIRVPSAACATQQAVVRIWRKPADNAPQLDGQGSARVYLQDAKQDAAAGKALPAVPLFAAEMQVEGTACR